MQIRCEALKLLYRIIAATSKADLKKNLQPIGETAAKLSDDSLPEIRDAGLNAMACLITKLGSPAQKYSEKLDEKKQKKLEEKLKEESTQAAKENTSKETASHEPKGKAPAAAPKAALEKSENPQPKPASKKTSNSVDTVKRRKANAGTGGNSAVSSKDEDVGVGMVKVNIDASLDFEAIEESITNIVPASVIQGLKSTKWTERNEAMDALKAFVIGNTGTFEDPQLVYNLGKYLEKIPGFKEANFKVSFRPFVRFPLRCSKLEAQVLMQVVELCKCLSKETSGFSRRVAALFTPLCCDKLGDAKLKAVCHETLIEMCASVGPAFIIPRVRTVELVCLFDC